MKDKESRIAKILTEYLIPLAPVALIALMTGLLFDTYYDINDDTAIRNILSGAFAGEPSAMAVYVEYPLAFAISLLYRIIPTVPWFGFLEHVMLFGSMYLVAYSVSKKSPNTLMKLILSFFVGYVFEALLLYRFIYVQYTTVAGIVAAAGAIYFFFMDDKLDSKHFLAASVPSILCEVLAFFLRPNMMLVEIPMIGVTYILKWLLGSKENQIKFFEKKNLIKYFTPLLIVAVMMAAGFVSHRIAYSSKGWKEYTKQNDERTTILDFQELIPVYGENKVLYDSIGWDEIDTEILGNYNIAIDDRINGETLEEMADYNENNKGLGYFKKGLKESLIYYKYKLLHTSEYKYAYGVIILYLAAVVAAVISKDNFVLIGSLALFAARSLGWMFIIMRGRFPERILIPLCFCEMIMLVSFVLHSALKKNDKIVPLIAMICLSALMLPYAKSDILDSFNAEIQREEKNAEWTALENYCESHTDYYYVLDVMSTVAYSEKIYNGDETKYANYEICGGWLSGNPLYEKKLSRYGSDNVSDALINGKAFFVAGKEKDVKWLEEYYKSRGTDVVINQTDSICVGNDAVFNIYSIVKVTDNE